MKSSLFAIAVILTISIPSTVFAARAGNYIGCVSESALDQLHLAQARGDMLLMRSLTTEELKCIDVGGLEYSLLERGFSVSKAKFYFEDGSSVVLWVPYEAVR